MCQQVFEVGHDSKQTCGWSSQWGEISWSQIAFGTLVLLCSRRSVANEWGIESGQSPLP